MDDLISELHKYIERDKATNQLKHQSSIVALQAARPDDDIKPPARIEPPRSRDQPRLLFHTQPVVELFVFNLPNIITRPILLEAFSEVANNIIEILFKDIKRKHDGKPLVFVKVNSLEVSLRIQMMCRNGEIKIGNRKLRVSPVQQKASVNDDNFPTNRMVFGFFQPEDRALALEASPLLFDQTPLSLEISVESRSVRPPSTPRAAADLMNFIDSKNTLVFRKIVLSDPEFCRHLSINTVKNFRYFVK